MKTYKIWVQLEEYDVVCDTWSTIDEHDIEKLGESTIEDAREQFSKVLDAIREA